LRIGRAVRAVRHLWSFREISAQLIYCALSFNRKPLTLARHVIARGKVGL